MDRTPERGGAVLGVIAVTAAVAVTLALMINLSGGMNRPLQAVPHTEAAATARVAMLLFYAIAEVPRSRLAALVARAHSPPAALLTFRHATFCATCLAAAQDALAADVLSPPEPKVLRLHGGAAEDSEGLRALCCTILIEVRPRGPTAANRL